MPSVTASVDLDCSAERAWSLLADVRRVPEWVPGVADASVLETDAAGRAVRVRFVGMPAAGSLVYVLRYRYDDAARTLRWLTDVGDDRSIEGEARISERPGGCRLDYVLSTWSARSLPTWAQATLADDTPQRTARAFKRWVEQLP